jgi:hypothetical protein
MVEVSGVHPEMQNRTIGQGGTGISFDNTHLMHRHLSASCEEDDGVASAIACTALESILQPGRNELVRNGHKMGSGTPKTP